MASFNEEIDLMAEKVDSQQQLSPPSFNDYYQYLNDYAEQLTNDTPTIEGIKFHMLNYS